jgi:PAS domain S-box-containing protein
MKDQSVHTIASTVKNFPEEEILALILNNLEDTFLLIDKDLKIVITNEHTKHRISKLFGITPHPGMSVLELAPPERHPELERIYKDVFDGKERVTETQVHYGQTIRHFQHWFRPARNEEGIVTAAIVTSRDISETKKSFIELQAFEERWRFALEGTNQGVWDWNIPANEVFYSSSYKKLYGFGEDDLVGNEDKWKERIHPEDKKKFEDSIDIHINGSDPYYESTYRVKGKDGHYKWILAKGMIIAKDQLGKPLRMIGTHTDITGRIKTEEELKRTNERFTYAAKASSEALWEWNVLTGEVYMSQTYTDILGWSVNEERKFDEWHDLIHPEDRDNTIKDYYAAIENPDIEIWTQEYRYQKKDGSYAFVHDKAMILRDENGKAVKVIGATQDVSSRRKIEEELKKSNERFLFVSRAASDAIYDWNVQTNELYWGEGLQTLFGFSPNEVSVDVWETLVHPDDRKRVIQSLTDALSSGKRRWTSEYRFAKKGGNHSHVLDRGFIIREENGKAIRCIGSMQDITERKQSEQLLSLERTIFELSSNPNLDFQYIVAKLLEGVEEIHEGALTAVSLMREDESLQSLISPNLPKQFCEALMRLKAGPEDGSCGAAIARKQAVFVEAGYI